MKRTLTLLLLPCLAIISTIKVTPKQLHAKTINASLQDYNNDGLGYGIDIVKNKYLDINEVKSNSPIFTSSFQTEMLNNTIEISISGSQLFSNSANSIKGMQKDIVSNFGLSNVPMISDTIFTANLENGFPTSEKMDYTGTQSHYFYNFISEYVKYTCNLPEYSSNLSMYRNNLHPDFIQDVNRAITDHSFESLFDKYGTHVIAKGEYGGRLELYYSITSNTLDVGGTLKNAIDQNVSSKIMASVVHNEPISLDLKEAIGEYASDYNSQIKMVGLGEFAFSSATPVTFHKDYTLWKSAIESKPLLIGTSSDGLIPIWELLPSSTNSKDKMDLINGYNDYVNKNNIIEKYESKKVDTYDYTFIRDDEKRITDQGRFVHDVHDTIHLDTDLKYSIQVLSKMGYKTVNITYSAEMKEIKHGYQYLFVYKSEEDTENHRCFTKKFELNKHKKQKDYIMTTFTFDDVPLSELMDTNQLVIRYGASGIFNDDWMNKNVQIKLTFNK